MNLFKRNNTSETATKSANQAAMSEMVLKAIHDGVIITDKNGVIQRDLLCYGLKSIYSSINGLNLIATSKSSSCNFFIASILKLGGLAFS